MPLAPVASASKKITETKITTAHTACFSEGKTALAIGANGC